MMVKSVIIEQLEMDGILKTFQMQACPDQQITIAFAKDFDSERTGPFHFQDENCERNYQEGFGKCRKMKVSAQYFSHLDGKYLYKTYWRGIITEQYFVSFYALSLPEYGIPSAVSVFDPHQKNKEYKRLVTRDDVRHRYVIYLECRSSMGSFDFDLACEFEINKEEFSNSSYSDKYNIGFAGTLHCWEPFVKQEDGRKVRDFLYDNSNEVGNIGPQKPLRNVACDKLGIVFPCSDENIRSAKLYYSPSNFTTKELGIIVTEKQNERLSLIDQAAQKDGTFQADSSTARRLRDDIKKTAQLAGFNITNEPVPNEGGHNYSLAIKIIRPPDNDTQECTTSIDGLPIDTDRNYVSDGHARHQQRPEE